MSEQTNIAWATSTFNPWIGCTKVSPGCDGCYAEALMDKRMGRVKWGAGQPRKLTSNAYWRQPLAWNEKPFCECMACGWRGEARVGTVGFAHAGFHPVPDVILSCPACHEPTLKEASRRVFCGSLCDVFDNEAPEEWREDLFRLIERTPHLTWMLLTKRIGNAAEMMFLARGGYLPALQNVWLGATVVNQEEADRDIPKLLAVPAAVRFLSLEPMLEPIDLTPWLRKSVSSIDYAQRVGYDAPHGAADRVDWVIVGGESDQPGHRARPFNIEWARDIVRQCKAAGVPAFFKQAGSRPFVRRVDDDGGGCLSVYEPEFLALRDRAGGDLTELPADLRVREFP